MGAGVGGGGGVLKFGIVSYFNGKIMYPRDYSAEVNGPWKDSCNRNPWT